METILHIGLPKTGTTVLQQTFIRSYDYLVAHHVLYPRNPPQCNFASHKILASIVMPKEKYGRDLRGIASDEAQYTGLQQDFVSSIIGQCIEHRPHTLVLSAEHLSTPHVRPAKLNDFLMRLNADRMRCAVYCRRPSEHFLSRAQQWIKASHVLPTYHRPLAEILELYCDALGNDAVEVRVFSRNQLLHGDIVADFCASFLRSSDIQVDQLIRGKFDNETLSAEAMAILIDFRRSFYPDANDRKTSDTQALLRALRKADSVIGLRRPILRPEIADAIDYSNQAPLLLRDKFGVEFLDFDYARLERNELVEPPRRGAPLRELVMLDDQRQKDLVQEVLQSAWANEIEHRLHWLRNFAHEP